MALTVNIYSFKKKTNSTLRPDPDNPLEAPVWTGNCLVKAGSQIVAPDLEIGLPANKNVSKWNYAYIPDWGRYYFISDMTYDNGQWVFHLDCDVLATYKTDIGNSTQYIARASYTSALDPVYNDEIIDTGYPTLSNVAIDRFTPGGSAFIENQCHVVGIINYDSVSFMGGVSYYVMSNTQLATLRQILLSSMDYMGVAPADQVLAKTEVNPFQYIVSCKSFPMLPYLLTPSPPNDVDIKLGWWDPTLGGVHIQGKRLTSTYPTFSFAWTVQHHPQAATRGAYLNAAPYCTYTLFWGPFINVALDPTVMKLAHSIAGAVQCDFKSGNAILEVRAYGPAPDMDFLGIAACVSAQVGVDEAVAQLSMNVSTTTPMGTQIADIASNAGTIGGMISGAVQFGSKIANYFRRTTERGWGGANDPYGNSNQIISEQNRTNANFIGANLGYNTLTSNITGTASGQGIIRMHPSVEIYRKSASLVDENLNEYGRPVCKMYQISTIPGFIKCATAELPLNATAAEQEAVMSHMTGGFHYE